MYFVLFFFPIQSFWFVCSDVCAQNSTCFFEVNQENDKEKIVQTSISIINGTDVKVAAHVFGNTNALLDDKMDVSKKMRMYFNKDLKDAKTFTVIYKHNATQTRYRKFNLGQRQPGDKQIYFESQNVTVGFRFAEKEFKYSDPNKFITSIGFSFEVSTNRIWWIIPFEISNFNHNLFVDSSHQLPRLFWTAHSSRNMNSMQLFMI